MTKVPQHFQATPEVEQFENGENGDAVQSPDVPPTAFVDTNRTKTGGSPDAPDAVWVCMTGATPEDVSDPESKRAALQYVAARYGSNAPSIDKTYGPMADDGTVGPPTGAEGFGAPMTARTYLQMAAQQNIGKKAGVSRYCYFVRVRRNTGV